ncbi:MAG: hypothetical protein GTO02_06120 [Candidatus Dadabacteria bacterium]|nr:hypothetical protein [Candidatus Dadabacteria bacterium]NIQ13976.1 hypothetical protein [Candidatus Dadabacteria bacterium]
MKRKALNIMIIITCGFSLLYLSCVFLAGAAAGGAGAYMMKEKGYDVQSPVKKN